MSWGTGTLDIPPPPIAAHAFCAPPPTMMLPSVRGDMDQLRQIVLQHPEFAITVIAEPEPAAEIDTFDNW